MRHKSPFLCFLFLILICYCKQNKSVHDLPVSVPVNKTLSRILPLDIAPQYLNLVDSFQNNIIQNSIASNYIIVSYDASLPSNILAWFKIHEKEIFFNKSLLSVSRPVLPVTFLVSYSTDINKINIKWIINWNPLKNDRDFYYRKSNPNNIYAIFARTALIGARFGSPYFLLSVPPNVRKKFNGYSLYHITNFMGIYRKPNDDYTIVNYDWDLHCESFTVNINGYEPQTYYYDRGMVGSPYLPDGSISTNALVYMFFGVFKDFTNQKG